MTYPDCNTYVCNEYEVVKMSMLRRFTLLLIGAAVLLLLAGCSSLRIVNERAVTIDEVIKMSQARVDKDVIIRQLEMTYSRFKLTPDDIVRLTEAGVDSEIIETMVESGAAPEPYAWEYGWSPYDNWVDTFDYYGYYSGYMYHYPYYSTFNPYMYMSPYMTFREPGLVGRFYHYVPFSGGYRPYFYNYHRSNQEEKKDTGEQKER